MKKLYDDVKYLEDMYKDSYYPNFLVDKIKTELEILVKCLEKNEHNIDKIQEKLDKTVIAINDLEEEFEDNNSEIETVARESIADTVYNILQKFNIDIDTETALRERNW